MWEAEKTTIRMSEGDYGVALPFSVKGVTLTASDCIKFVFKDAPNGETILTKDYTNLTNNTANLMLTETESALFEPGVYTYTMEWYQNDNFQCNLIENGVFKVGDVA